MSGKIKSKDLSYEQSLPPFLQRLRAQNAGSGDADRHERPIARPKRAKDPDVDDGPTVVDESGELMSKEQLKQRVAAEEGEDPGFPVLSSGNAEGRTSSPGDQNDPKRHDQKVTDGTASKKRKAVKIIGEDAAVSAKEDIGNQRQEKKPSKKAKKAKHIKLAFDEEDGS